MVALDFPSSPANGQTYGGYYWDASTGAWRSDPVPMGGLPAGSIIQWAGATAPANWLFADGAAVSRTTYASLYAAIGTTYGAGDGSTTFNLPDLRGRVPVGKNGGTFGTLGATGGAESVTLTAAQSGLPAHSHSIQAYEGTAAVSGSGTLYYTRRSDLTNMPLGATPNAAQDAAQAHNNLQPYQVVNYIIKATTGWSAGDSELATRVGALEAAPAGLVRIVPTSVSVGSGSASVSSTGLMSFNSASSVTLNGVFSAAFKNYRIHMNIASYSVAGDYVFWRSVTGGSGVGGTYVTRGVANDGSSVGSWSANGSAGYMGRIAGDAALAYDLFDPFTTRRSRMVGQTHGYVSSENMFAISSMHDSLVSYNGIQMYMNSGLIEGTIQVYGYRN